VSPSLKRRLAIAAATAGVVSAGWHAVLPDEHSMTPQGRQEQAAEAFNEIEQRKGEQRKQDAELLDQAIREDELRPRVYASPEAEALARRLLRKVP
jgi:hypothetical protein